MADRGNLLNSYSNPYKRSAADEAELTSKITEVINTVNEAIKQATFKDLAATKNIYEEVKDSLIEREKASRKRLEEDIAEYRIKGILENLEEEGAYRKAEEDERSQSFLRDRLNALKQISKEAEKEREKENKALQRKIDIQKKLNSSDEKERQEALKMQRSDAFKDAFTKSFGDFTNAVKDSSSANEHIGKVMAENMINTMKNVGKAIQEGLNQINTSISKYAQYQTAINTRLQGTSSFSTVSRTLNKVAYSPLVNAETLYSNINSLVGEGIAYNLEQRAFLMTIKDAVATTFDANQDSLKRMIRIQQEDSTASRLGMESYLTRWLNEYIQNTEYLTNTFDSVADSLFEASAILRTNGTIGVSEEFEYIVQKWLATLTGVGLSNNAATQIASAIGALGSGDISGLGSGVYNLLTIAAGRGNQPLGNMLNSGLTADDVNTLLYNMTVYLKELNDSSSSNVVKSQLAKTFGVSITDLLAASNLESKDLDVIFKNVMSRNDMYNELTGQMNSISSRMGIANILENMFSNYTYQTGMNIAANPVTYAIWKITDLIQSVTGGINIPFVSTLGNAIGLETTVENLMKLKIIGASTLSQIGNIVNGLRSIPNGGILLEALNIKAGDTMLKRGSGISEYVGEGAAKRRASSITTSSSAYIGDENSSAYKQASLTAAKEEAYNDANVNPDDKTEQAITQSYLSNLLYSDENRLSIAGLLKSLRDKVDGIKQSLTQSHPGNITPPSTDGLDTSHSKDEQA